MSCDDKKGGGGGGGGALPMTEEEKMKCESRARRLLVRSILSFPEIAVGLSTLDHFKADPLFSSDLVRDVLEEESKGEKRTDVEIEELQSNIDRSTGILRRLAKAYCDQSRVLWSSDKVKNILKQSMEEANNMFVNRREETTVCAAMERRFVMLEDGVLLRFQDVELDDESASVHLPAEDAGGVGGGGAAGAVGAGRNTGQMELDANDPMGVLIMQLLMPWNTLTPEGAASSINGAEEEERKDRQ
jgi:hypothetical protein